MNKALYLFCLTPASALPMMEDELLPSFSPLFIHPFQTFNAILSWVPAIEYQDQSVDSNLINAEEFMKRVFFHELVVEKIMRDETVFPIGFGTLFSSIASLEEQILTHETFIASCLTNLNQKDEYAVRVYLNQDTALERLLSTMLHERESSWASSSPGVQYLKKQQLHNEIQRNLNQHLGGMLDEVLSMFQRHATDFKSRENTAQSSDIHGTSILHWAFLIPRSVSSIFKEHVDLMNAKYDPFGLHFVLTGPWPAYSFCTLQSVEAS